MMTIDMKQNELNGPLRWLNYQKERKKSGNMRIYWQKSSKMRKFVLENEENSENPMNKSWDMTHAYC